MRFYRPPLLQRMLMPGALFRLETNGRKEIALTFDDGPDPDSTPVILDILGSENVRAVFFCTGEKAEKYPCLLDEIVLAGHQAGNHGYHHIKGIGTRTTGYVRNVQMAAEVINGNLFRPPYGSISLLQYKMLRNNFRIVMWDLMPYDFDNSITSARVKSTIIRKVRPGSIIVLHDCPASHSLSILRETIRELKSLGFNFVLV